MTAFQPISVVFTVDAQAITRIIDAVRASAKCELPEINRASLQDDIVWAQNLYGGMKILGDKTFQRELRDRLTQIRKSAQRIVDRMEPAVCRELVSKDRLDCRRQNRMDLLDRSRQTPEDIRGAVQHLIRLIDTPEAYGSDPYGVRWPGSPFVRVAGRYLRKVFERHFGMPARYTFDPATDEVRGVYVDFVEHVLAETKIFNKEGKPYTRKSIADALTETRQQEAKRENLAAE